MGNSSIRRRKVSSQPADISEQLRYKLFSSVQTTDGNASVLLELLYAVIADKGWLKHNLSFRDFITKPYSEHGIGWRLANLEVTLKLKHDNEDKDAEIAEKMRSLRREVQDLLTPPLRPKGGISNIETEQVQVPRRQYGNNRNDIISRLKRDHPDIAQQVLDGKLSAAQGAIQAGFKKPVKHFDPSSPKRTAVALRKYMTKEQLTELIALLHSEP